MQQRGLADLPRIHASKRQVGIPPTLEDISLSEAFEYLDYWQLDCLGPFTLLSLWPWSRDSWQPCERSWTTPQAHSVIMATIERVSPANLQTKAPVIYLGSNACAKHSTNASLSYPISGRTSRLH